MFGGLAGIGLIVVAWVSYERRKYRKQFRDRKTAERIRNAVGMRQTMVVREACFAPRKEADLKVRPQ